MFEMSAMALKREFISALQDATYSKCAMPAWVPTQHSDDLDIRGYFPLRVRAIWVA
jgi:hypothetical protein